MCFFPPDRIVGISKPEMQLERWGAAWASSTTSTPLGASSRICETAGVSRGICRAEARGQVGSWPPPPSLWPGALLLTSDLLPTPWGCRPEAPSSQSHVAGDQLILIRATYLDFPLLHRLKRGVGDLRPL